MTKSHGRWNLAKRRVTSNFYTKQSTFISVIRWLFLSDLEQICVYIKICIRLSQLWGTGQMLPSHWLLSLVVLLSLKEAELPNVLPESPAEQIVEFSIDLVDPGYRELLDDPDSPQYIDLAHHLQDQVWLVSLLFHSQLEELELTHWTQSNPHTPAAWPWFETIPRQTNTNRAQSSFWCESLMCTGSCSSTTRLSCVLFLYFFTFHRSKHTTQCCTSHLCLSVFLIFSYQSELKRSSRSVT